MCNRRLLILSALLFASLTCTQGCTGDKVQGPDPVPLPTVQSASDTPAVQPGVALPSPGPGFAVVWGMIVEAETQRAPLESVVYLGEVVRLDNGTPVVRLERKSAPFATPSAEGWFIFGDVQPGEYGLVVYTPDFSFLVDNPRDAESLIFTVHSEEVLDLGTIEVVMP